MMVAIVVLVSLFMIGIGLFGLASPPGLAGFVARWESRHGLWTATLLRVIFGLVLWRIAPATQTPATFQILGLITLSAGFVLPLLGLERFMAILAWWRGLPPNLVRLWALFPALLGAFLLWSALA